MKMKRLLTGVVSAGMVMSLAACGGSGNETATTTPDETGTPAVEGGENTLTVWCWDPAFNIYAMEEAEKLYQTTHEDFTLNLVEVPWPDIQTKIIASATSGDTSQLPDVLLMQDNAFQKNVISYPEIWKDLDASGINYNDFSSAKTAYSVVNGKHYGVPFDNGAVVAVYRTDVLEEAGYTIDDFTDITWSKWIEQGKKVLEKTGKPLLSTTSTGADVVMMMLQSAGGSLFDKEGNPSMVDNEILMEVVKTYQEMIDSKVLLQVNDWDQYVSSMTTGEVAGTINGCWILGTVQSADDQSGKWALTNMPKLDNVPTATNYSNNGGSSWAVTANCQNTELAYDFLKSTFGSSVEFYETILPQAGALSCYVPAGESDVYGKPQEFFAGQPIYKDITEFATKIPSNNTGVYYYEGSDAIITAVQNIVAGADPVEEIKNAQDTVEFVMSE